MSLVVDSHSFAIEKRGEMASREGSLVDVQIFGSNHGVDTVKARYIIFPLKDKLRYSGVLKLWITSIKSQRDKNKIFDRFGFSIDCDKYLSTIRQ